MPSPHVRIVTMNNEMFIPYIATICFALAVLHTFSVKWFQSLAQKYQEGSIGENFFHLLGEVEVVFGIWAGIFIVIFMINSGFHDAISYLESRNFTEPMFVFVIMTVCASKPILELTKIIISVSGRLIPVHRTIGYYIATLVIGPLLGSLITEPAAMTVTALILMKSFFERSVSDKFRYATLGLLFVNVSIGGTLTPFAAPPVLMVAAKWNWDLSFMLTHFGWKAFIAILISTLIFAYKFRSEIASVELESDKVEKSLGIPGWVTGLHLLLLSAIVFSAHYMVLFVCLFLLFLGIASVTKEYQNELKVKEALLVGFFLGGLVVLGGYQSWWLQPLLVGLNSGTLYLGAALLTAITDNAALTYLGSQVENLSEFSKYVLVAGSVVGGGLTVIANAPNPAGYSILNSSFGSQGISAKALFVNALLPTAIAGFCFWFL